MMRFLILLWLGWGATASADVPERLEQAFRGWVDEAGVSEAVLTIWQGERHHRDVAIGMQADAPVELASLSKAVTALCAAQLIRKGRWTVGTQTDTYFSYFHEPLSVAELMTHAGGLAPDETQDRMADWLDQPGDRSMAATRNALSRGKQRGVAGKFQYNNENYAILAAMIAIETGEPYVSFCHRNVLEPAGVTSAMPSSRTGAMAGWGGWQMSVQDYARLMRWGFGPEGIIGANPAAWPDTNMGGGVFYGVGMTQRPFRGGMNYWHFGLLCFEARLTAGSYAVIWEGDWQVVAAYEKCTSWEEMVRLDNLLARAVYQ